MTRSRVIIVGLILFGLCAIMGLSTVLVAQTKLPLAPPKVALPATQQPASREQTPEAGIKSITQQYVKAFNAKDAKAAAALWTENGEFIDVDGVTIRGRAAIEKSLADDFKMSPKATLEASVDSVRSLGRNAAVAEGTIRMRTPANGSISETRYSAMHVLEDGQWLTASASEWIPDAGTEAATKYLDWLVGDWTATGHRGKISITYAWDENKKFLHGKYTIANDGKIVATGTQVMRHNPSGGLRSWSFESSGAMSNSTWEQEGNRWIEETTGTLSNGTPIDSISVCIPLGQDAFCWQTVERSIDGVAAPSLSPIKVTRVKASK